LADGLIAKEESLGINVIQRVMHGMMCDTHTNPRLACLSSTTPRLYARMWLLMLIKIGMRPVKLRNRKASHDLAPINNA